MQVICSASHSLRQLRRPPPAELSGAITQPTPERLHLSGRMHTHIGTQNRLQQQLELTTRATTTTGTTGYNSSWNSQPELQQPPEPHSALNNKGLSHNNRRSSGYNIHRSRGNNKPHLARRCTHSCGPLTHRSQRSTTNHNPVCRNISIQRQASYPARSKLQPQTTPRSEGASLQQQRTEPGYGEISNEYTAQDETQSAQQREFVSRY